VQINEALKETYWNKYIEHKTKFIEKNYLLWK